MNGRESSVLNTVERYYKEYGLRAKELKAEGKEDHWVYVFLRASGDNHGGRMYSISSERKHPRTDHDRGYAIGDDRLSLLSKLL